MADSLLITTVGGSTSNSLCTLAEANTYLTNSFYGTYGALPSDWEDMADEEKEYLLIMAGLVMNAITWIGWPVYEDQAMCWPRWLRYMDQPSDMYILTSAGVYRPDESEYYTADTAKFPVDVKKSQAFIAYDVFWRGLQNRTSPSAGPASDAIKSLSLFGEISISFEQGQEIPMRDLSSISGLMKARCYEAATLLGPYVTEMNFIGRWDELTPTLLDAVS